LTMCGQLSPSSCNGHSVAGYHVWANASGTTGFEVNTRPFSTPNTYTILQNPLGTGTASDSHLSWANDQSASGDGLPIVQTWTQAANVTGNGSMNLNSNPCSEISGTWNAEVDSVATSGSGLVWRFAHTRGGDCSHPTANSASFGDEPIGSVSQDGKYALFHSTWGWLLGSGYAAACATSHTYGSNSICIDSNGNYETSASGGTSGSTAPTWNTVSGGTTSDGTITWTMNTGCSDPNNPIWGEGCRTDVFVVELR